MPDLHERARDAFLKIQTDICAALAEVDGTAFHDDAWTFRGEGGGLSRVIQGGNVFEKGGVNFSDVAGEFPDEYAAKLPGKSKQFRAAGISLVLHPANPFIPTVHANFRHIVQGERGWFGGGADLTPYYPYREDCISFHQTWKEVCDRHSNVADHARFKAWCDEYFFLAHRQEPRGIGGIFFDYLETEPEATLQFVTDAGGQFLNAYLPIVVRRRYQPFSDRERDFQLIRRGRYVEFNLIYDRGTTFGLQTGGRTESILMSLPPLARWVYNYAPEPGSKEAELFEFLRPRNWAGMTP